MIHQRSNERRDQPFRLANIAQCINKFYGISLIKMNLFLFAIQLIAQCNFFLIDCLRCVCVCVLLVAWTKWSLKCKTLSAIEITNLTNIKLQFLPINSNPIQSKFCLHLLLIKSRFFPFILCEKWLGVLFSIASCMKMKRAGKKIWYTRLHCSHL